MLNLRVRIFTLVNGRYVCVGTKFLGKKNIVKVNKKAYVVDTDNPLYIGSYFTYYGIELNNGQVVRYDTVPTPKDEIIDIILSKESLKQLASTLVTNLLNMNSLILGVILFGLGFMMGMVFGPSLGLIK